MASTHWPRASKLARICRGKLALAACWLRLGRQGLPADLELAPGVHLAVTDGGAVQFGAGTSISRNATIIVKRGTLQVGRNVFFGIGSVVVVREAIRIGDGVLIAEYVTIRDQDHAIGEGEGEGERLDGFKTSPVTIGDGVWLGAKVTVTRGVTIGAGSVIGANSVVTRDIPPGVIAAGAPARVVRVLRGDEQAARREAPAVTDGMST